MSKNNLLAMTSESRKSINGSDYIEIMKEYYESTMYDNSKNVIAFDVRIPVYPVFNPIPKIVNLSAAIATTGTIETTSTEKNDNVLIQDIVNSLGLNQEKMFIAMDLIKGKSVLMELQTKKTALSEEEALLIGDALHKYALGYYPSDMYDIQVIGNDIVWCQINGSKLTFNEDENTYIEVEALRTYVRKPTGEIISFETVNGEVGTEVSHEYMPLVEVSTNYDMYQLLYSIDRYNELDSFIRNVFYLSGEPILTGTGVSKLSETDSSTYAADRYTTMKTLFTKNPDAQLKYIEFQGSSVSSMIKKQEKIIETIVKDFPEYAISEVLSGGNVSYETTRIRLTEVLSRIQNLREGIVEGFNQIIRLLLISMGNKDVEDRIISMGEILTDDVKTLMPSLQTALTSGILSKESAMSNIKKLFIGEDVLEEINRIEKDKTTSQQPIVDNVNPPVINVPKTKGTNKKIKGE